METPALIFRKVLDEKLLDDDSGFYSITTYPLEVAEEAAHVFLKDFENRKGNLDLSKKKRVKFIDEFVGVALGFPVADFKQIDTAVGICHDWFENLTVFGDVKRQNKFLRRLLRQLSQPFAFREAVSYTVFENQFLPILFKIFDEYENFAKTRGEIIELETWDTLYKCVLLCVDNVICYDFSKVLSLNEQSKLKKRAVSVYFQIALTAGITTKELWDLFDKYCKKWSFSLDFLEIWGIFIQKLTQMVFSRKLSFETDQKIEGGVYTNGKEIDTKSLEFIYHHFLYSIDIHLALSTLQNFHKFQSTIFKISLDFMSYNNKQPQSFFIPRFPAKIFLKLFGPYITNIPLGVSEDFDLGLSTVLLTILSTTVFEFQPNDKIRRKLIQLALKILGLNRPQLISSFMFYGHTTFSQWNDIQPYLAQKALEFIPKIDTQNIKFWGYDPNEFFFNATSIFTSAAEIYHRTHKENDELLIPAFNKIYNETPNNTNRVTVLTVLANKDKNITLTKIADIFQHGNMRKYATEENIPYLCTLITMVSTVVKNDPSQADSLSTLRILPSIVSSVTSAECRRLSNCDLLIAYSLATFNSLIEGFPHLFAKRLNINAILELTTFVQKILDNDKKNPIKSKKLIKALHTTILNRMNIHYPSAEYFTRKHGSFVGTEEELKKEIGLTKPEETKYYHCVVGSSIFLTFLERKDGKGPIGVVARGQFGRACWIINDKFKPSTLPTLTNQLKEEKLPEYSKQAAALGPYENQQLNESLQIPEVSIENFKNEDKKITKHFKDIFYKWLTHDHCYIDDFDKEKPYLRPRVTDFLLHVGILDITNKLRVKPIYDAKNFADLKLAFDKLDSISKVPITVSHIMIGYTKPEKPKQTKAYSEFIKNISETFQVESGKWLPAIPVNFGYALLQEDESEFPLEIVFNDSNYDFNVPPGKKQVLSITPLANGLYKVLEKISPREGISPFPNSLEYTVDINTLRLQLALCIDMVPRYASRFDVYDKYADRKDVLKPLFEEKPNDSIAPEITLAFKSN